jgi:PhnB protein
MNIPEHYKRAVIPYIVVKDVAAAIHFYAGAFGASQLFRLNSDVEPSRTLRSVCGAPPSC